MTTEDLAAIRERVTRLDTGVDVCFDDRRALLTHIDALTAKVGDLNLMQPDGVIQAMNGETRSPRTTADWVEVYRAAVLAILRGEA